MSKTGERDSYIVNTETAPIKPKNLFTALAEIEHFSLTERNGGKIEKDFLTSIGSIDFTTTGFRESFFKGLISAALVPIMFLAQNKLIMFAGSKTPTLFDNILMLLMSTIYTLGIGILIRYVFSKCYTGDITKEAMKTLLIGVAIGKTFVILISFLASHLIAFIYLTHKNIHTIALTISKFGTNKENLYITTFLWILEAKNILIPSFYFILIMNSIFILLAWSGFRTAQKKTEKFNEFREEWD